MGDPRYTGCVSSLVFIVVDTTTLTDTLSRPLVLVCLGQGRGCLECQGSPVREGTRVSSPT